MSNRKYRDVVTNTLNIFEENGDKVRLNFNDSPRRNRSSMFLGSFAGDQSENSNLLQCSYLKKKNEKIFGFVFFALSSISFDRRKKHVCLLLLLIKECDRLRRRLEGELISSISIIDRSVTYSIINRLFSTRH